MNFGTNWVFKHVLGEGTYGKVYLLLNEETSESVAVKVLDSRNRKEIESVIKKEIGVHRMLHHENIIQFLGNRVSGNIFYIILQFASNGELFDLIEPDVGMTEADAKLWFTQLMAGLNYLHNMGVTHRDIKPENLLIGADNLLKISDFGLATLFRIDHGNATNVTGPFKGYRKLDRMCGTVAYAAPEVLMAGSVNSKTGVVNTYDAPAADLFSCGVTLLAMLTGELPWERASVRDCRGFSTWCASFKSKDCNPEHVSLTYPPWNRLSMTALSLLRVLLHPNANRRSTSSVVMTNSWLCSMPCGVVSNPTDGVPLSQCVSSSVLNKATTHVALSQPFFDDWQTKTDFLTQTASSQTVGGHRLFVCRLTRITLRATDASACAKLLRAVFSGLKTSVLSTSGFDETEPPPPDLRSLVIRPMMHCQAVFPKKRIPPVQFIVAILAGTVADECVLANGTATPKVPHVIDFRLSKGDGLQFKRFFRLIRDHELLKPHIVENSL